MKWNMKISILSLFLFIFTIVPNYEKTVEAGLVTSGVDQLNQEITSILSSEKLVGSISGLSIRSAETGEIILERGGNTRLRPASNMKLLTSAVALDTLGENYVFTTELLTDGKKVGSVLNGNLYLKGKGDPTLLQADFEEIASSLKGSGIKTVLGDLIGDDTWYDSKRYSPDLNSSDENEYYGAAISALTVSPNEDYDAGTVIVDVNSGKKIGDSAVVSLTPKTDYVKIVNKVKTVAADSKKSIKMVRDHGSNVVTITGEIPLEASRTREWVAVWEPTGYAISVFKQALQKQGIKLIGKEKIGKTPERSQLLTSHESMPLAELLVPFMKLSNNTHAEHLVKEIGKVKLNEGSWDKGLEIIEKTAHSLGVNMETVQIRDGSGISQMDLIPANEITNLLYTVQSKAWYPTYLNALPVAGNSERFIGGTLRNRMKNSAAANNVQAKTGSLTAASTLSGYVTTKSGQRLIFSILLNNYVDDQSITKIQDDIAILLAEQE